MGILKPIIITILSILFLSFVVPGISIANWSTLLVAGLVLTLLQTTVRPILKILLLPINIITLGTFAWVINVFILWLSTIIVPGFHVNSLIIGSSHLGPFLSLALVSFGLGIVQSLIDSVI